MEQPTRAGSEGERGFTLAGVIVLMTLMMIIVAYTVPRQWSAVLQRDRDRQTIFAMHQYARACREWAKKHANAYPISITQLKEARNPRFMRGVKSEMIDPLTGQVDWLIIPQSAAKAAGPVPGQSAPVGTGTQPGTATPPGTTTQPAPGQPTLPNGQPATTAAPGVPMKDYAGGPFVGVRPPKTGKSMLELNGEDTYEKWMFTALDLDGEIAKRMASMNNPWK